MGASTKFSIGWSTAQTACQLARVCLGHLRQGDENVHVCIFNFPDAVPGCSLHDREHVEFGHRRGQANSGFSRFRNLTMVSPFYDLTDFRLSLAMDVARNRFCIRVDDDVIVSEPGFFLESNAPGSMHFGLPAWRNFVYSQDSHPAQVDVQHLDVNTNDALMLFVLE